MAENFRFGPILKETEFEVPWFLSWIIQLQNSDCEAWMNGDNIRHICDIKLNINQNLSDAYMDVSLNGGTPISHPFFNDHF